MVGVGCPNGKTIPFPEREKNKIKIAVIGSPRVWISLALSAIIVTIIGLVISKKIGNLIKGSGKTRNRAFSLGRFQLAWWICLTIFSFVLLFAITGDFKNIFTTQSAILLAISAGSTIGSSTIDSSEGRKLESSEKNYLSTLDEYLAKIQEIKGKNNLILSILEIELEKTRYEIFKINDTANPIQTQLENNFSKINDLITSADTINNTHILPSNLGTQIQKEVDNYFKIFSSIKQDEFNNNLNDQLINTKLSLLTEILNGMKNSITDKKSKREFDEKVIANLDKCLNTQLDFKLVTKKIDESQAQIKALTNNEQIRGLENHSDFLKFLRSIVCASGNIELQRDSAKRWIKEEMNKIEQQSDSFFIDVLSDPSGNINIHRYQIFIWTIILGLVFIYKVLVTFKMPEFDTTLLALQGISSGTFLALKTQEKPANQ